MKRITFIFIACSLLLAGCWDEQLYKEISIVPLMGLEGEQGKLTGHYMFTTITNGNIGYSTVEGNGVSTRDTRLDANRKASETLDLTQLEVILLTEEIAKLDITDLLNSIFRTPRTRLSTKVAMVKGEMAPFLKQTENVPVDLPDFYNEILKTDVGFSFIPDLDVQKAARLLLDEGIDLALPLLKMSEAAGIPEVSGLALFSGKKFTGKTLDKKESIIVQILQKKPGKYAIFTYMWKKGDQSYPITVELASYKKNWNIGDNKIDATYKMKFSVDEFAHDHLDEKKLRSELDKFLSKELTTDFNKVIQKLQEAKSDAVGFGRSVRAFHPSIWNRGKWQDTFSELDIQVKVEAEITRTGILN